MAAWAAALGGCALNADFDDYDNLLGPDQLSGSALPGYPSDDVIESVVGGVFVSDATVLGPRALRVDGTVTFRAGQHEIPDQYVVSWRGAREAGGTTPTVVRVLDDGGHEAVVVRMTGSEIAFLTGEAPDAPLSEPLTPGVVHEVAITIRDRASGQMELSFDRGTGGEPATWANIDLRDDQFSQLSLIRVEAENGAAYAIDDVLALLR